MPRRAAHRRALGGKVFANRAKEIGRHLVRERYTLGPDERATGALLQRFRAPYYACMMCVHPGAEKFPAQLAKAAEELAASAWVGVSALAPSACAIKILAPASPDLRAAVAHMRAQLFTACGIEAALLRRVTGENLAPRLSHTCGAACRVDSTPAPSV